MALCLLDVVSSVFVGQGPFDLSSHQVLKWSSSRCDTRTNLWSNKNPETLFCLFFFNNIISINAITLEVVLVYTVRKKTVKKVDF